MNVDVKPIFVTFRDLCFVLAPLHQWHKERVAEIHDIWLQGAPSPDTRLLDPKHYDPRKDQPGNVEKRLLLPTPFANWVVQQSTRLGFPYTHEQALSLFYGHVRYT